MTAGAHASAFAEDACYPKGGGIVSNCTPLPKSCRTPTFPTSSPACLVDATTTFAAQGDTFDGGRSSVHVDATHVLAQSTGFTPNAGYWIAAYDQATDLGSFAPRDLAGRAVDPSLDTKTVDGLVRTRLETGGVFYHFAAPAKTGTNGLDPDLDDPHTEVFLAHARAWALDAARASCAGGLTSPSGDGDYATGTSCFPEPGTIEARLAAIGSTSVPFDVGTGLQIVTVKGGVRTSDEFDAIVGAEHAGDARLGVYLHALADRISHHVCLDRSLLSGPTIDSVFNQDMSNADCAQGFHALRHMWEVGVDFTALPDADQTTKAALGVIYDELTLFAERRGVHREVVARDVIVGELLGALQTPEAAERLLAIRAVACAHGLAPFPGLPACPTAAETATATKATTPATTTPATTTTTPETASGCAMGSPSAAPMTAVLGVLVALGLLRRKARA